MYLILIVLPLKMYSHSGFEENSRRYSTYRGKATRPGLRSFISTKVSCFKEAGPYAGFVRSPQEFHVVICLFSFSSV